MAQYVEVTAAIIERNRKVLVCQRKKGSFKDKWEFPGGKVEAGESLDVCLRREIKEELRIQLPHLVHFATWEYDYGESGKQFRIHAFWSSGPVGSPQPMVHQAFLWVDAAELHTLDFLAADRVIIPSIVERLRRG